MFSASAAGAGSPREEFFVTGDTLRAAPCRRSRSHRRSSAKQCHCGASHVPIFLAKDVGCDRTYVGRMLRLTSLAPDIIEAILQGEEPDGLSLEKLRKDLPVRWDEQSRSYGC